MIIYPIGLEKTLDTPKSLSASYVNLFNNSNSGVKVNIIDLDDNIVASLTLGHNERLTIIKPVDYTLSATNHIHAVPVIRTQ